MSEEILKKRKLTFTAVTTLTKAAIVGFLFGEIFCIENLIASSLNVYVTFRGWEVAALIYCGISLGILLLYIYSRNFFSEALIVLKSYRFDLLVMAIIGLLISVSVGGVGLKKYSVFINSIAPLQLILLISLPIVLGGMFFLKAAVSAKIAEGTGNQLFISDNEKEEMNEDLLGVSNNAIRFAERVINGGSKDSMVFGIDAPWGAGKSSFVNFCLEYWEKNYHGQIITYKFNPLRYEDRTHLLEKFVDGLVQKIQTHSFIPEIEPIVSRYSKFIKAKNKVSLFGIDFDFLMTKNSIEDAFDDLESALIDLDKKIIIVVDDLDRLPFSSIEDILFTIKKSFTLPNVSYILCYDTENISDRTAKEKDTEKVREFLEKFVNVKVSLFLDSDTLSNFVTKNFERAIQNNLQVDSYTLEKIKETISEVKVICKSPDFHNYQEFLGDIRKLKRLINTLMLFEIEKTDFENSDFNKRDLINLLLIYINYPKIFRKIYNTETDGKRGFFSLVTLGEKGYPALESGQGNAGGSQQRGYRNSVEYTRYVENLPLNAKFLLDEIFLWPTSNNRFHNIEREKKKDLASSACFNGTPSSGRNLEQYLNLIVKLSKPPKRGQNQFYINAKNQVAKGTSVEKILSDDEFDFSKGEDSHELFWRVIVNSAHEFNVAVGHKLITYLKNNLQNYSLLIIPKIGLGLRDDLPYSLILLLDRAGWSDVNGSRTPNTAENISQIAEWIFGEGRHVNAGIIDALGSEDRGVMGLFDLMLFRLSCCLNRGGDIFNLYRSLSIHGDRNAPTEGSMNLNVIEEMREMSQRIYRLFENQYIDAKKNIFEEIDKLNENDLAGKASQFIKNELSEGNITISEITESVAAAKARMKSFIIFQFGNSQVEHGVGCGYYDAEGKNDSHGIADRINGYLFADCFGSTSDTKGYEYFLDYLLINLSATFGFSTTPGYTHKPQLEEFAKVLDKSRLREFWRENKDAIIRLDFPSIEKEIRTQNYAVSYQSHLSEVFNELDKLLIEESPEAGETLQAG